MPTCTLRAPNVADGPSIQIKPILFVKFNGRLVAYAARRNGHYDIEGDAWIGTSIDQNLLKAEYKFDADGEITHIELVLSD
jgi:hypothetical protein